MPEILKAMLKEEWRIHSLVFGNRSFSFFPAVMAAFAFLACIFLPLYARILDAPQMAAILHSIYVFFGLSVGGFGLLGREALNRRLGDTSLVAYSSRTLPVSERRIFADFVVKDTLFYMLFLIVPFFAGYVPARLLLGLPLASVPHLAVSLALAFLYGLSISFALSTAYAHWGRPFLAVFGAAVFAYTLANPGWLSYGGVTALMPPLQYYLRPGWGGLLVSLLLAVVPSAISIRYVTTEYHLSVKRFPNQYAPLQERIGFGSYSTFLAKDVLDLNRSEGGLGKVAGSYVLPLAAVALVASFFSTFLPVQNYHVMLVMALMAGVISTSLYSWLAEYDFKEQYDFLPIPTQYIMKAKLILYACSTAAVTPAALVLAYIYLRPPLHYLGLGLLLAASTASYTTAVTAYLCGLRPNIMLYSSRVFVQYLAALLPPLLPAAVAFMTGHINAAASAALVLAYAMLLLPSSLYILDKSYARWGA